MLVHNKLIHFDVHSNFVRWPFLFHSIKTNLKNENFTVLIVSAIADRLQTVSCLVHRINKQQLMDCWRLWSVSWVVRHCKPHHPTVLPFLLNLDYCNVDIVKVGFNVNVTFDTKIVERYVRWLSNIRADTYVHMHVELTRRSECPRISLSLISLSLDS